jgi:hypothetical protein
MAGIGIIHRTALYDQWLAGMLGDTDTPTARRYGPDLFKASTFSWDEWNKVKNDPKAYKDKRDDKQKAFKDVAARIEKEDPDAYANLQGRRPWNRVSRAVVSTIIAFAACFFVFVAAVMAVRALLVIRMFVLTWPLLAIVGAHPSQRQLLTDLANRLVAAILDAALFLFGAGAVSLFMGAVLGAQQVPLFAKTFLALVVSIGLYLRLLHSRLKRAARLALKVGVVAAVRRQLTHAGGTRGSGRGTGTDDHGAGERDSSSTSPEPTAPTPTPTPPPPVVTTTVDSRSAIDQDGATAPSWAWTASNGTYTAKPRDRSVA